MTDFKLAQSLNKLLQYVPRNSQDFAESLVRHFKIRGFFSRKQCLYAYRIVQQARRAQQRNGSTNGGRNNG